MISLGIAGLALGQYSGLLVLMQKPEQERMDAIANSVAQLWRRQDEIIQRLARIESSIFPQEAITSRAVDVPAPISAPAEQSVTTEEAKSSAVSAESEQKSATQTPKEPKLETKVGLTIINRVGVLTLVLGIAFFFKWAVDSNWIGPDGRVILGVLAGFTALGVADFLWRRGQQVFAQGVTGAGVAFLYLAFYAAFSFYQLLPQAFAFLLMFAVTSMAIALSIRYGSQAIAALGFSGAFAIPLVLSNGEDHPWFLLSYLLLLNTAALTLDRAKGWYVPEVLSFASTAIIYGDWLSAKFTPYKPRTLATLALFAYYLLYSQVSLQLLFLLAQCLAALTISIVWSNSTIFFFLFSFLIASGGLMYSESRKVPVALSLVFASFWISYGLWELNNNSNMEVLPRFLGITLAFVIFFTWFALRVAAKHQMLTVQRLSVLVSNGVVYYGAAYGLLYRQYHGYLGLLAVAVATAYLGFGYNLFRRRASGDKDIRLILLSVGMALCFITLAIPIQFTGFTITAAWSLQAATLTWIGLRFHSRHAVEGALFVFALMLMRLLLLDSAMFVDAKAYQLLWNKRFVAFIIASASLLTAAHWASIISRPIAIMEYFAGQISALWGLTLEVLGWAERSTPPQNLLSVETVAISILSGIYAVVLVSVGVSTKTVINRITGLGLIGIIILKLYFFDVWQLERVYRMSAFVALGLLLMGISFLYSRFRQLIDSLWKDDKANF